ncbi:hypothetical protein J7L60_05120 [Candidatus Bathyarchaeota archaeon]|nr:hypothetical protein [Candidatus Bathyarchaeota archaeon]
MWNTQLKYIWTINTWIWKYVGYNPRIKVERRSWVLEGDRECRYEISQE